MAGLVSGRPDLVFIFNTVASHLALLYKP